MPAKDLYHEVVKTALIKDGWTITDDPFRIRLARGRNLFVDLGAERLLAAERSTERIAVEVKSFTRPSDMKDLEEALGQFVLYARLLIRHAPERTFAGPSDTLPLQKKRAKEFLRRKQVKFS